MPPSSIIINSFIKLNAMILFQVPLIVPICLAVTALVLAAVPIVLKPQIQYVGAVVFIALGICVYYPFVYLKKRLPFMGNVTLHLFFITL